MPPEATDMIAMAPGEVLLNVKKLIKDENNDF